MFKKNNATHKTFEQRAHCKYFFIVLFKGKNCLPTGVLEKADSLGPSAVIFICRPCPWIVKVGTLKGYF